MFRELRGMEYILEIIRVLSKNTGYFDSKSIYGFIVSDNRTDVSLSYIQKVLQRMVKLNLLTSSETGYTLIKPLEEITIDNVLQINDMPPPKSRVFTLCETLLKIVKEYPITQFYDFK